MDVRHQFNRSMALCALVLLAAAGSACAPKNESFVRQASPEERGMLRGSRHLDSSSGLTDLPAESGDARDRRSRERY